MGRGVKIREINVKHTHRFCPTCNARVQQARVRLTDGGEASGALGSERRCPHMAEEPPAQEGPGSSLAEMKFLTVAEVATVMRVSRMTVYRLVHNGDLNAVRVGKSFRVPEREVHEYLRNAYNNAG
jgi:excisionase family DNA binding protein